MRVMRFMWFGLLAILYVSTARAQSTSPKASIASIARWPQDRSAAISLTFDDGINTDLDFAGPILKKHRLNGTFFVATTMGPWEKRKQEWKQLARDGNELANHTVHHPCLLPEITPHSQDYTPEMMEHEIADAAREIDALLDSHRGLTFAYPCGNMSFGQPQDEVKNAALYTRYVSEHAFAARGVGAGAVSPEELNVLDISDLGPTADKSFVDLLNLATPAFQAHNWGVYCFHGVGGDWLAITPEALDELAGYLERHSEVWSATFGDVLRYIQERKAASVAIQNADSNAVAVTVRWPLDAHIYDLPLTLRVEMPTSWTKIRATGDGKQITSTVAAQANSAVILVEVPAQTKLVTIEKQ